MKNIKELREQISKCDDRIIEALAERMNYIEDIITYKKNTGMAILQPEQEDKQLAGITEKLKGHKYEDEIQDVFKYIMNNSKKIQAKALFSHNIFLIGFMGAGKSTVSAYLSKMLAMDVIEADALIVKKVGMSIADMFEKYGEEYFRNEESNMIIELEKAKQSVISCGGGAPMREHNVQNMKRNGRVVLLTASSETIYERVKDSTERPLLNNNMNIPYIDELMEKRKTKYEAAADIVVNTDNKTIQEICEDLICKMTEMEK
jgi:shikimate kinase